MRNYMPRWICCDSPKANGLENLKNGGVPNLKNGGGGGGGGVLYIFQIRVYTHLK